MQVNKNGIRVHTPGEKTKRKREVPNFSLRLRSFVLIDDEAEVEVVVPHFSPVIKELKKDGWREIK